MSRGTVNRRGKWSRTVTAALGVLLFLGAAAAVRVAPNRPFAIGYGKMPADIMLDGTRVGGAEYWNTRHNFIIDFEIDEEYVEQGWRFKRIGVHAGDTPQMKKGKPKPRKFPCTRRINPYSNFRTGSIQRGHVGRRR